MFNDFSEFSSLLRYSGYLTFMSILAMFFIGSYMKFLMIKHSFRNLLRSWPKSALFLLLLTALGAMLCIGVSLMSTLLGFLRECDDNYTTIAVFEYIGVDYPDETRFDPDIGRCMEEFDFGSLTGNHHVLNWDENAVAFASIVGKASEAADPPFKEAIIAVIYILSFNERIGAYQYSVVEDLINKDAEVTSGYIDTDMIDLQIGHLYLVHGTCTTSSTGIIRSPYYKIALMNIAAAAQAGVEVSIEDMILDVSSGGGNYELPEESILYPLAVTYATMNAGVTVFATNDASSLFPFQQGTLSVVDGRTFSAEEYTDGAKVCLLPKRLAESLHVGIGESVDLSIAIQAGATQRESFWAGSGFLSRANYTVVGILSPNDDYRDTVYIPKSEAVDFSPNKFSFKLGQVQVRNDSTDLFIMEMEEALPPRVRVTVYDQGYAAAADPVRDVLRIAIIVTVGCALVTLAMLTLFGFLFVYRQRGLAKTMRRVGVSSSGIFHYFTIGAGFISLLGAGISAYISYRLSWRFIEYVIQTLDGYGTDNLRYSNAALTVSKSFEFIANTPPVVFALTAISLFVFAVLACFVFTAISVRSTLSGGRIAIRRSRVRHTEEHMHNPAVANSPLGRSGNRSGNHASRIMQSRSSHSRKSRNLSGGTWKYALLSVLRGRSRSAIPFVLCALAAALFMQLTRTTVSYMDSYGKLLNDTNISGYLSDYRGMRRNGLLIDGVVINDLYNSGILSGISVSRSRPYEYGLEPPENYGGYAFETYMDALSAGPDFIWTNDLASVQEFYGCPELPVSFMDGYDLSVFSYFPPNEKPIKEFSEFTNLDDLMKFRNEIYIQERWEATPAVVSTAFLEANSLALGDTIHVPTANRDHPYYENIEIVGSFVKQGSADNIYVSLYGYYADYSNIHYSRGWGSEGDYYSYEYLYVPASYIYDPDPNPDQLRMLTFESASFQMRGASGLDDIKAFLYDRGYSEVNTIRDIRSFIVIEDKVFLVTERAMAQRLWYMQRVFPALFALLELLSLLIPFILIQLRKRESALMRAQGAAKRTVFLSFFWEQAMLCVPGVAVGVEAWLVIYGKPVELGRYLNLLFALLWMLGAAISAASLNRGSVRVTLRAVE